MAEEVNKVSVAGNQQPSPAGVQGAVVTQPPAAIVMESWYQNKKLMAILDLIQKITVAVGIPIGIYTYWTTKNKESHEAELATYEKMDDRYWSYQRLCMEYPQLDVSDATAEDSGLAKALKPRDKLTAEERLRERQIMYLVLATCERAFLLYADKSSEFKKRQWDGWEASIRRVAAKPSFREAWAAGGFGFDTSFQKYIHDIVADAGRGK
jgi:hypothetical protein